MPIYEYRCISCKGITEIVSSSKDIKKNISCEYCNDKANKIISSGIATQIPHIETYFDTSLGRNVTSRTEWREEEKKGNVRLLPREAKEYASKRKKEINKKRREKSKKELAKSLLEVSKGDLRVSND